MAEGRKENDFLVAFEIRRLGGGSEREREEQKGSLRCDSGWPIRRLAMQVWDYLWHRTARRGFAPE